MLCRRSPLQQNVAHTLTRSLRNYQREDNLGVGRYKTSVILRAQHDAARCRDNTPHPTGAYPMKLSTTLGTGVPTTRFAKTLDELNAVNLALRPGMVIDSRYELVEILGRGGMGEVWSARHLLLMRNVAIKFVSLNHPETVAMLLQEAQVLASFEHPAVVHVFDCGMFGQSPYLVMEQLNGETLAARLLREGALSSNDAISQMLPIVRGLEVAHTHGIVHRDLKPDNIFLETIAMEIRPKLIDFGIADAAKLRINHASMGTPPYMSPEQIRGEPSGPATDIWALGVTLYELMVGTPPFCSKETIPEILQAVTKEPLSYPRNGPPMHKDVWRFLTKCTRKDPSDRFENMGAARLQLEDLAGRVASTTQPPATRSTSPSVAPSYNSPASPSSAPNYGEARSLDDLIRRKL
jgi:eukaryotic-like serine/threonine-protein kinase